MPRLSRVVFAGLPHHITQRGNRREDVFFNDEDRLAYLEWLHLYCEKHAVDILAYCLMTNHIHLVAVPQAGDGLQKVLKPLHMRYAQRINRAHGWRGHLWQGRYFSSPLDESCVWSAVRYVERNPVRAGMVKRAENYRWSSAAGHCGLRDDVLLADRMLKDQNVVAVEAWSDWLAVEEERRRLDMLRKHVEKGLPCGSDDFVERLGKLAGRILQRRPQGRPRVEKEEEK
ncbi:MAG: transposase [Mariprofundus sp.]